MTILIPSKRHLVKWDADAVWFLMLPIFIQYSSVKWFCVVIYCRLKMEVMKSSWSPLISMSHKQVPVYELPALSKSIIAENILCVCAVMMIGVRPPFRQRTWP